MMADTLSFETAEVYVPGAFSTSPTLSEFATALALAQASIGSVTKDKTAKTEKYSYTYAELAACLEAIRGPLTSNGLALIQGAFAVGNRVTVSTRLIHKSGEWVQNDLTLTAKDASPQAIGSAITYGRRYGVSALTGLAAEDDDGKAAQPQAGAPLKNELPAAPPGFQDWLDDLASTADNGYPAFAHAWKAAPETFRTYGTAQHKATLAALRKRAEAVKVIA